ncbi:MAG: DUF2336 domain-containing protein [Rhizobiaceae bacterium]|nr:DUF2336 domain-containing protein [Rhizobiaceae bacterium]
MVVAHFLRWIDTAKAAERAAAAAALARAYLGGELEFEDRCAAEAALTFLLDDPSAKVRHAMAEALSMSPHAPAQVIAALAADQPDVASVVLARSPVLTDADLIDRVAAGDSRIQAAIAMRPAVSMGVAAAIAEIGAPEACRTLLANHGAAIAALSYRRMAERFGDDGGVRESLLADPMLPPDSRHLLLTKVGEALKGSPLIVALMGKARAERVTRDACLRASITVIDGTSTTELGALVEHLRLRGDLTPGFVVRAVAMGKIDFLGAVLVSLTGQGSERVRALLTSGRDAALTALLRSAAIPAGTHAAILTALHVWREVAVGKRVAGTQEVTWLMLKAIGAAPGQPGPAEDCRELATLLKAIHLEELRANARGHALAIAAA